jgi:glycosyltransferase involved in cell wall biosynthesis
MQLVSVIVCVYNAGPYLRPAIDSIVGQTYHDLEIIIIDDGSTDGCMDTLHGLEDSRIRVFRQENRGRAAALNRALEHVRGAFYVIQDADDISCPRRIELLVDSMGRHPEVAGMFSGHDLILGSKRMAPRQRARDAEECKRYIDHYVMPAHDPTGMFRMSLVGEFRYDLTLPYTEAVDYIFRVGERYPLMVIGQSLYSYRIHTASITKRDPSVRQRYAAECFRRACERRGASVESVLQSRLGRTAGANEAADNNLAAEFMESALDQRAAGRWVGAVRTGIQCSCLHPLDFHYHKALIYALAPSWVIPYLRRNAI